MTNTLFDACKGYINAQSSLPPGKQRPVLPAITISREAGAGAVSVAKLLVEQLEKRMKHLEYPWAVFDKNLVERILEDHELPKRIKKFMSEDESSGFVSSVEELFGLHPSAWTMFEHTTDTISRLAHAGHCIIVGRGSNLITAHMSNVFHVRLVGPVAQRIKHCEDFYSLTHGEAIEFVEKADGARRRYVSSHFKKDIDNPHDYDLVINTGRIRFDQVAGLIADAVVSFCR